MPRVDLPLTVQQQFFDFHWDRQRLWEEAGRVTADIDGYHRLVKCKLESVPRVMVKKLDRSVIPRIRVEQRK